MEGIVSDSGNAVSNKNSFHTFPVFSPRHHSVAREIKHCPFTFENKASIFIQYKVYRLSCPTCGNHFIVSATNKLCFIECTANTIEVINSFSSKAVRFKIIVNISYTDSSDCQFTACKIYNASCFCICCPTAIHFRCSSGFIGASRALQGTCRTIINICVLVVVTVVNSLAVCIKDSHIAVYVNIISSNDNLIFIGCHAQVYTVEINRSDIKIKRRIIHYGI